MAKPRTTAEEQMAARHKKPQSIEDLAPSEEPTAEEIEALEEQERSDPRAKLQAAAARPRSAELAGDKLPDWVKMPDLTIPKGVEVAFMRFTDRFDNERQIIIWELSVRDERLARGRTMGDFDRLADESAKQMIRAIDGEKVDEGNPLILERFWDDLRAKDRAVVKAWFHKAHTLSDVERVDFFKNRVASRRAV